MRAREKEWIPSLDTMLKPVLQERYSLGGNATLNERIKNVAYFNFDEHEEYKQVFEKTKDVSRILQNLMMASRQVIHGADTLISLKKATTFIHLPLKASVLNWRFSAFYHRC